MTAEDVLPENTGVDRPAGQGQRGLGPPLRLRAREPRRGDGADQRSRASRSPPAGPAGTPRNCIPPEAQIDAPDWFAPIDVDRVPARRRPDQGAARRAALQRRRRRLGASSTPAARTRRTRASSTIPGASGTRPGERHAGHDPEGAAQNLADNCDGSVGERRRPARRRGRRRRLARRSLPEPRPGAPRLPDPAHRPRGGRPGQLRPLPQDPVRLPRRRQPRRLAEADRHAAPTPATTSPARAASTRRGSTTSTATTSSTCCWPTSSGELYVLDSAGDPLQSFNGGQPVTTDRPRWPQNHPAPPALPAPRESLRTPAIGDIDGDLEPEIVATAGEHVYAWDLDGTPVAGFPVRHRPGASDPCKPGAPHPCFDAADRAITHRQPHQARLLRLAGARRPRRRRQARHRRRLARPARLRLGRQRRRRCPGFPGKLATPGADGAEIITSPAIAELDGRAQPEIVSRPTRSSRRDPQAPDDPLRAPQRVPRPGDRAEPGLRDQRRRHAGRRLAGRGRRRGRRPAAARPARPRRGGRRRRRRRHRRGLGLGRDLARRPGAAARRRRRHDGLDLRERGRRNSPTRGRSSTSPTTRRSATSPGDGTPAVVKGGLTVNGAANLLAANQNLPFSHVEQAWDSDHRAPALPGYPRATDDFQLLSQARSRASPDPGPVARRSWAPGCTSFTPTARPGRRRPGWPKFTGGWIQPTPAVGDADGDGELDVTALHARGLVVPVEAPASGACGGLQQRVVDLPPRRARHRQLRHRRAPARHAREPRPRSATARR